MFVPPVSSTSLALSDKCPKGAFLMVSGFAKGKRTWCQKKTDQGYFRHGPEVIYGPTGKIKEKNVYRNGVLVKSEVIEKTNGFSFAEMEAAIKKRKSNLTTPRSKKNNDNKNIGILLGHNAGVTSLVFDPTGEFLVSGDKNGIIKVWNFTKRKEKLTIKKVKRGITSIVFNPNGKSFFSGGRDRLVRCWNLQDGNEIWNFSKGKHQVFAVAVSFDGKYVAFGGGDKIISVLNAKTGQFLKSFSGHTGFISSISFSNDGKHVVSAGNDKTIRIWNLKTGSEILEIKGHTEHVSSIDISNDGRTIVSGGYDRFIKFWDMKTGKPKGQILNPSVVRTVSFSPSGKYVSSGSFENIVDIVRTDGEGKRKRVKRFAGHTGRIYAVAFEKTGKYLVSGSLDKSIRIWKFGQDSI